MLSWMSRVTKLDIIGNGGIRGAAKIGEITKKSGGKKVEVY